MKKIFLLIFIDFQILISAQPTSQSPSSDPLLRYEEYKKQWPAYQKFLTQRAEQLRIHNSEWWLQTEEQNEKDEQDELKPNPQTFSDYLKIRNITHNIIIPWLQKILDTRKQIPTQALAQKKQSHQQLSALVQAKKFEQYKVILKLLLPTQIRWDGKLNCRKSKKKILLELWTERINRRPRWSHNKTIQNLKLPKRELLK